MLRTVAPFVAGFAASYAGHLGPQGWIFLTGLSAGFGAGYWFARSEGDSKSEEINYVVDTAVVEEEVKPNDMLHTTNIIEKPLVENEDIQPYDSDNTDEFYSAIEDLKTGDVIEQLPASMKTKTSSLPVPNDIGGNAIKYTRSDEMSKISGKILELGVLNITKDSLRNVNV